MSTNSSTLTVKSNQADSLNNGLLFQPVQTSSDEPFFLSPPPSAHNEFPSSTGKTMQTSTLIISTPPQYHYYLYPPPPPSSSSRKHAINNRTISNVSINSVSTNSSSSHTSYESPILDIDDETFSSSTYSTSQPRLYPKQFTQPTFNHWKLQALLEPKPVILSDSVQAFWPPPPRPPPPPSSTFALNSDPEQTRTVSAAEQVSSLVHLTVLSLFNFALNKSARRVSIRNANFCSPSRRRRRRRRLDHAES